MINNFLYYDINKKKRLTNRQKKCIFNRQRMIAAHRVLKIAFITFVCKVASCKVKYLI